jgi:hypothetical protein
MPTHMEIAVHAGRLPIASDRGTARPGASRASSLA